MTGEYISSLSQTLDKLECVKGVKFRFMESLRFTAILKSFEFLRQFSKNQNMIKKNYQLNRNKKFVDKAQLCTAFFCTLSQNSNLLYSKVDFLKH